MILLEGLLFGNLIISLILLIAGIIIYAGERTTIEPLKQPEWERAGAMMIVFCWAIPAAMILVVLWWVATNIPRILAELGQLMKTAVGRN